VTHCVSSQHTACGAKPSINTHPESLFCKVKAMRVTIINLQTFGDNLLKAPFLHELYARFPEAEVTVVTNPRGAQVYPQIDSRLHIEMFDKNTSKLAMLAQLRRLPKADVLYLLDMHPASVFMALAIRAKRKVGWKQSVSLLWHGPQAGFRNLYATKFVFSVIRCILLDKPRMRSPEGMYEGHVELLLLDQAAFKPRLAEYRSAFSLAPAPRPRQRTIYCATQASWRAKQLDNRLWSQTLAALLGRYPNHRIVVDGDPQLFAQFNDEPRLVPYQRTPDIADLFRLISGVDVVICSDSFLTHLASWFDVPSVSFFGPSAPHRFQPTAPGSTIIYHHPECSPCIRRMENDTCLAGHETCLSFQQIEVREILEGVSRALTGAQRGAEAPVFLCPKDDTYSLERSAAGGLGD